MSKFVPVAKTHEIPASGKLSLEIEDRFVVLVRIEDQYYCVDDVCTHDGGPLGEGELQDHCLVCPRHGAKFDVTSGRAVTMPATEPIATHEVKVQDNQILVRLSA